MNNSKLIYFASDVHLGTYRNEADRDKHDMLFVRWLEDVSKDADKIYLLGDIFDFWFEYRNVVPNGYGRVLAKLREVVDRGIEVHFFVGNHDMWTFGYLEREIGLIVHKSPEKTHINGRQIVLGHGNNLRLKEGFSVLFMNWIFTSKIIYNIATVVINADLMLWAGRLWSRSSRDSKNIAHTFRGEKEPIVEYCRRWLKRDSEIDGFVFGHLHTPTTYTIEQYNKPIYILGEWISNPIYGRIVGNGKFELIEYR